jgi:hypothetical protein
MSKNGTPCGVLSVAISRRVVVSFFCTGIIEEARSMKEQFERARLRFGTVVGMYYEAAGIAKPRQLDMLAEWLPGMLVSEREDSLRLDAEYIDQRWMIEATRVRGHLFCGTDSRVTQIIGRLIGTARGNAEKERKTAELLQKHLAEMFVTLPESLRLVKQTVAMKLDELDELQIGELGYALAEYCMRLAFTRDMMSETEKYEELFPMDDEVYEDVVYNASYQLTLDEYENLVNGYTWLIVGSILRNQTGRIARMFQSGFVPVNIKRGEYDRLTDKICYLFMPEDYEPVFEGDEEDLKLRFPDVNWICDGCGDALNQQKGFTDEIGVWMCRKCGYLNVIDYDRIFDNREDYLNDVHRFSEEQFTNAIRFRKRELDKDD